MDVTKLIDGAGFANGYLRAAKDFGEGIDKNRLKGLVMEYVSLEADDEEYSGEIKHMIDLVCDGGPKARVLSKDTMRKIRKALKMRDKAYRVEGHLDENGEMIFDIDDVIDLEEIDLNEDDD